MRGKLVELEIAMQAGETRRDAYVNGTEFFYKFPEMVLDVGVKGMINVIDACRAADVRTLILASSSEVYQTPPVIPTDETVPLIVRTRTIRGCPTAQARSSAK